MSSTDRLLLFFLDESVRRFSKVAQIFTTVPSFLSLCNVAPLPLLLTLAPMYKTYEDGPSHQGGLQEWSISRSYGAVWCM